MRYLCMIVVAVLLVACSREAPQGAGAEAPRERAAESRQASKAGTTGVSTKIVLPGATLELKNQIRARQTYRAGQGVVRKKLICELLEQTPQQSRDAVTAALVAQGYVAGAVGEKKDGRSEIVFKKAKAPSLRVTFYPALADKPANPSAKSMVKFDWIAKREPRKPA